MILETSWKQAWVWFIWPAKGLYMWSWCIIYPFNPFHMSLIIPQSPFGRRRWLALAKAWTGALDCNKHGVVTANKQGPLALIPKASTFAGVSSEVQQMGRRMVKVNHKSNWNSRQQWLALKHLQHPEIIYEYIHGSSNKRNTWRSSKKYKLVTRL